LNAICRPSGDHVGSPSTNPLFVSVLCPDPSAAITRTAEPPVKAISSPSGDQLGSPVKPASARRVGADPSAFIT